MVKEEKSAKGEKVTRRLDLKDRAVKLKQAKTAFRQMVSAFHRAGEIILTGIRMCVCYLSKRRHTEKVRMRTLADGRWQ
eukprot:2913289-Pleurochrysis_carterae.AAC.1